MSMIDFQALRGERIPFEFKGTDGGKVRIWCDPPTPNHAAISMKMTELDINDDNKVVSKSGGGNIDLLIADDRLNIELAKLCIAGADNLEGWPENCRKETGHGRPTLNDAALSLLTKDDKGNVSYDVLIYIGRELNKQLKLTKDQEGNSESLPSGNTTESETDSPTEASEPSQTAASAPIPS